MSKSLFNEFEGVSSKAWKQKIQVDLKGADYNDTLIYKNNEGIDVKPFYHADEFEPLPEVSDSKATEWKICQSIDVSEAKEANYKAIDAIKRGAESILFQINTETISLEDLLQNINTEKTPIEIKSNFLSEDFINKALNVFNAQAKQSLNYFHTDIIGNLTKTGNWFNNLKEDHIKFEAIINATNQLSIDLSLYQNAGATMVQQLAYGLAHVNEYLNHLDKRVETKTKESLKVTFNVFSRLELLL